MMPWTGNKSIKLYPGYLLLSHSALFFPSWEVEVNEKLKTPSESRDVTEYDILKTQTDTKFYT